MNKSCIFFYFFLLWLSFNMVQAQDQTLKLWPGSVPDAIEDPEYKMDTIYGKDSTPRLIKVTDPTLEVYLAPEEKSTGMAVIVCPGGGYHFLAVSHEGHDVAAWLNDNGITGIILNYRLPDDAVMKDKNIGPLQDTQEAIRIVRRNSKAWKIDPGLIGILGFSAGGHLASTVSTQYDNIVYLPSDETSARPDFSILIYPVISLDTVIGHAGSRNNLLGNDPSPEMIRKFSNDKQVREVTPPAFLVHSVDDGSVDPENSIRYLNALRKYNIPCELHLYEGGGHGYGLGRKAGTESAWPDACIRWLRVSGFLK